MQFDISQQYQDPFSQRNQTRTMAALKTSKRVSIEEVMQISRQTSNYLSEQLKLQTNKQFLQQSGLVPLPKEVRGPLTRSAS